MSLTAPVKPTPPTVPQVKLQPVESSSQNQAHTEAPSDKNQGVQKVEKPAAAPKTEQAVNNSAPVNKSEQTDQNKVPVIGTETNETTVANTTAAVDNPSKQKFSSYDMYAAIICLVLFAGVMLYFFWRRRNSSAKPEHTRPSRKKEIGKKPPRTVIDYSAANTKEIIDMLTSPDDLPSGSAKSKAKNPKKVQSNFEFRV